MNHIRRFWKTRANIKGWNDSAGVTVISYFIQLEGDMGYNNNNKWYSTSIWAIGVKYISLDTVISWLITRHYAVLPCNEIMGPMQGTIKQWHILWVSAITYGGVKQQQHIETNS